MSQLLSVGNIEGIVMIAAVGGGAYFLFFRKRGDSPGLLPNLGETVFGTEATNEINDKGVVGALWCGLFPCGPSTKTKDLISQGDADTLKAANEHADQGDKDTLKAAETYADQGDENTLKTAIAAAQKGDADTLQAANKHADQGDKDTLEAANAHTDTVIAPVAAATVVNRRFIDHLESEMDVLLEANKNDPLLERNFLDTDAYYRALDAHPEIRATTTLAYDACHTGANAGFGTAKKPEISVRDRIYNCLALNQFMENGNRWEFDNETSSRMYAIADQFAATGRNFPAGRLTFEDTREQEHDNLANLLSSLNSLHTDSASTWINRISQMAHPTSSSEV